MANVKDVVPVFVIRTESVFVAFTITLPKLIVRVLKEYAVVVPVPVRATRTVSPPEVVWVIVPVFAPAETGAKRT